MSAVISMTTLPGRLPYLEKSLAHLARQGPPVYLWLPRHVRRLGKGFDDIPDFVRGMDVNVEIVEDKGPATKLLYALELFETVISADDDCIYGDGWADGFLRWAEKKPRAALGYRGRVFGDELDYRASRVVRSGGDPRPVDLITSCHGTLYRRSQFDDDIFDAWEKCPKNDDIMFGGYLCSRGIPMYVIPKRCGIDTTEAHSVDSLWGRGTGKRNNMYLKQCYPEWPCS